MPTAIEQGVAGYDVESWNALAAPTGTPPAVIERLQRAAQEALAEPEVNQRLAELGVRAQAGTPAQLRDLLASEIQALARRDRRGQDRTAMSEGT